MRVLYPMLGDTIGGSHLSTLQLIKDLNPDEVQPVIALHHCDGPLAQKIKHYEDVSDVHYPASIKEILKSSVRFINAILRAKRFLKRHDIEIIHCDDGPLRHVWFYAAKLAKIPYIHIQHTLVRASFEKNITYPRYDACVACSEAVRDTMPEGVQCKIAYPCIDIQASQTIKKDNRVIYVANMREQKRPFIFLEMIRNFIESNPKTPVQFLMVGAFYDDMQARITEYIDAHDLNAYVEIQGFNDSIEDIIASAKILVVPAVGDAFGRTLIEAMALETAVIAANSGGHKDIITHEVDGILVEPDCVSGFVQALEKLLQDSESYNAQTKFGKLRAKYFLNTVPAIELFETLYKKLKL